MSASGEDKLKVPIEIKTEDLDEIRELINEISQAENDLRSLKATPRRGKGKGDDTSRSAFTEPEKKDEGGIFGRSREGDTLPLKGRDTKSKTPVQRENEFAKLQRQVAEQETRSGAGADAIKGTLGLGAQAAGFGSLLGAGGAAGPLKAVGRLAGKAFLPLAIITTVVELISTVIAGMLRDGGILDRRFKRDAKTESLNLSSLAEKAEFTQGERIIRVTTIAGQRGTASQQRSNLDYIRNGVDVFDIHGVLNKGIGAGTI